MKVDSEGNIYCGGSGGVHILNPGGERLGIVAHGQYGTTRVRASYARMPFTAAHQTQITLRWNI